ncbi:MAG: 3'(2'),5'-bisphosphate nucleotidase CysQ [Dehalococcoidia bacterium]|nr:3'(2'),5'-bisphosphate nucleotidase CysQ [Dehalococcoidia bacterium]
MLAEELRIAVHAATKAGEEVLRLRREGLRYGHKGGWDLVTEADIRAAEILHDALTGAFPGDGWLSEEHTDTSERLGRDRVWIVDPIDGTREYLQGLPEYAISIGLVIDGQPALGVVHNPATNEMHAAVSAEAQEAPELIVPGRRFDVLVGRGEQRWDEIPPLPPGCRSRGVGSVAYRLALVAAGKGDAVLSAYGRSEWDVAAGIALCHAAGLRATDIFGRPLPFNQRDPHVRGLLVARPGLHRQLAKHIGRYG